MQFALAGELQAKRPKDVTVKRLRVAVERVQSRIALNRARAQLYPVIRHPRPSLGGKVRRDRPTAPPAMPPPCRHRPARDLPPA